MMNCSHCVEANYSKPWCLFIFFLNIGANICMKSTYITKENKKDIKKA